MNDEKINVFIFAIFGNILNFAYNILIIYLALKKKNTKHIPSLFIYIQIINCISWLLYSGLIINIWFILSYSITLLANCIILYVKLCEKFAHKISNSIDPL